MGAKWDCQCRKHQSLGLFLKRCFIPEYVLWVSNFYKLDTFLLVISFGIIFQHCNHTRYFIMCLFHRNTAPTVSFLRISPRKISMPSYLSQPDRGKLVFRYMVYGLSHLVLKSCMSEPHISTVSYTMLSKFMSHSQCFIVAPMTGLFPSV